MDILIVEDDRRLAALLERGLNREGHVTALASDGPEGLDYALAGTYDVVILDVMLPGLDGLQVARRLRDEGCRTPVLMLTARDARADIIAGLDTGADDYLTKPFAFDELLARLRAVARRGSIAQAVAPAFGDLSLDPGAHEAWRGARRLSLTPREFRLLELLIRHQGRVLSRDAIIERVWGHAAEVRPNTVDAFISTLRRKVDGPDDVPLIQTIRAVGFCLREAEP